MYESPTIDGVHLRRRCSHGNKHLLECLKVGANRRQIVLRVVQMRVVRGTDLSYYCT
jgi:hypothetical protein